MYRREAFATLALIAAITACSEEPGASRSPLAPAISHDRSGTGPLVLLARPGGDNSPVPIPGGFDIPPLIHVWAPGPTGLGLMGTDVEPSVITNFNGLTALAFGAGTATDANGASYNVQTDMRLFRGEYVSADGTHHNGTFCFV